MSKKNILKSIILIVMLIILMINIPIFKICTTVSEAVSNIQQNNNVCVLKYTYTTGSGWTVLYDNQNKISNQNVVLYNMIDPRFLRDNKDFELDYIAQYVIVIDKIHTMILDNEEIYLIYPKNITIIYDSDKRYYKLTDISIAGIIKSLMGVFNKDYRFCY